MFGHLGRNLAPEVSTIFSATMSPAGRVGQVGHISYPSRISVPSRGLCFLETCDLKQIVVFGSAFLAGAFIFWENHDLKEAVVFGSAFLARAFDFL